MSQDFINGGIGVRVIGDDGVHNTFKIFKGSGHPRSTILLL